MIICCSYMKEGMRTSVEGILLVCSFYLASLCYVVLRNELCHACLFALSGEFKEVHVLWYLDPVFVDH